MSYNDQTLDDIIGESEEIFRNLPRIKGLPHGKRNRNLHQSLDRRQEIDPFIIEQLDTLKTYDFTYAASRHEKWWLLDSLGPFYDEQWFDDVVKIIKGGKEASVYLCKANPSAQINFLAAKVYRPRSLRNLRKDFLYREGRARLDSGGNEIRDGRMHRAMRHRTYYGQELMHTSWIEHEYRTLQLLHLSGCDVPRPYASDHNAILMDYVGDQKMAAPTLNGVRLGKAEADTIFHRLLDNLNRMLANNRVHGDLSAYNILFWEGEITLIDFPQAINPKKNPNAYPIFQRDLARICEYFTDQGLSLDHRSLALDLWEKHGFSTNLIS